MKNKVFSSLVLLVVAPLFSMAVSGQRVFVTDDKIEPGEYRQIRRLELSGEETVQMRAGEEKQLRVLSTVTGRNGMYREVVAPTTWSVHKTDGVAIDGNGKLTVAPSVKHNTKFKVTAKVSIMEAWEKEGFDVKVEQDVVVFDTKLNPLVGVWSQKSLTPCSGEEMEVAGGGLRWLEFRADGTYSAAAAPFETYNDYWGKYTFDAAKGTLALTIDGSNDISDRLRLEGEYSVKADKLTLAGLQLLSKLDGDAPCRIHFSK